MHSVSQKIGSSLVLSPAPPISAAYLAVGMYSTQHPGMIASGSDISRRLTQPLNTILGRRGTIFFACIFSSASCLAQAFSSNWQMMVGFRILLGLGFGPKSATIPIYASECAPAHVRGALVMFWQFFTAFGIMMGYICGAAFRNVLDGTNEKFCPQPVGPSHRTPKPPSTEDQIKLLRTNCVSKSSMTAPIVFFNWLLWFYIRTKTKLTY
jgi:MFS family permease